MIKFYRTKEQYGAFSNFSKHSVEFEGKVWPTSEHAYQAQKFESVEHQEWVRSADTAREAAIRGRSTSVPMRREWDGIKCDAMLVILYHKFTQHEDLKQLLLSTAEEEIVEYSPYDTFWGSGKDGTGLNMLGKILMRVRHIIRHQDALKPNG